MEAMDGLLTEAKESMEAARNYRAELRHRLQGLSQARRQIGQSAVQTRAALQQHFQDIRSAVSRMLDDRLQSLLQQVDAIEHDSIKPLDDCQKLLEQGVNTADGLLQEGAGVRGTPLMIEEIQGLLTETTRIEEIQELLTETTRMEEIQDLLTETTRMEEIQDLLTETTRMEEIQELVTETTRIEEIQGLVTETTRMEKMQGLLSETTRMEEVPEAPQ
ncbi:cytokine receptor-like factor 3 [Anomaloglossus baeobatrachus]|uniref:cytokine receptor-like factor 3 n=1 Tax=Anomaloglossus baeobatrachus TaxID=238106 RepID=UPI003F4F9665